MGYINFYHKIYHFNFLLYCLLLSCSSALYAQWVETTGQAYLVDGDYHTAKKRAIQDAIQQALLYSGVSISSVQELSDGLITQSNTQFSSQSQVQSLEILSELTADDRVTVNIRADITPEFSQCPGSQLKKTIAITQFNLLHREQAKVGQLYTIGKSFSKRLFYQFKQNSQSLTPRPWLDHKIDTLPAANQYFNFDYKLLDHIAENSHSQFVLIGNIVDLSLGDKKNSTLAFWQDDQYERFFAFEFFVLNTLTKELIYRDNIGVSAHWSFDLRSILDLDSQQFWRSAYGQAIQSTIKQNFYQLEEELRCEEVVGKILAITDQGMQLNLGSEIGIHPGQQFSLIHRSDFTNDDGIVYPVKVITPYQVKIHQVYTHGSIAKPIGSNRMTNIQVGDLVTLFSTH